MRLLAFILIITLSINAQNIEVTYQQALTDKRITKSNSPKFLKGINYLLKCNANKSEFYLLPIIDNKIENLNAFFVRRVGGESIYFKNLKKEENIRVVDLFDEKKLIKLKSKNFIWKISSEKKMIGKYNCYKAILQLDKNLPEVKRHKPIVAWFSPKIPIPFGPLGYDGLPGLILRLDLNGNTIVAKKIKNHQNLTIKKPKGEEITEEELFKRFKNKTGIDLKKESL
ncbi:GLPGLI family protein [Tenacibaculum aiptasiae]|uniref:GLPGLI family protein n=1 Tax=Tenacibaculum aiptasiae TaxID=426481 RepID=UPI003B5BF611